MKHKANTAGLRNAALIVLITTALMIGLIATPSKIVAQAPPLPGMMTTTNATIAKSNITKPVDGYNTPQGHLSAIRHVFDDPALRVQHYCKPNDKIVLVCQLYDSDSKNATLIGVEYIITTEQYNSLPNREKPNWHAHKIEFAPNRVTQCFQNFLRLKSLL